MYNEKLIPILEDLENKEIDLAGGSVVGMALSTINSLIIYISNLTLGKKRYEEVQDKIKEILKGAGDLKIKSLQAIDKDKEILEEILDAYKIKKENKEQYQIVCKKATEFCMQVLYIAKNTYDLAEKVSKYGNKMLSSDFEICRLYSVASIKSAIVNVEINLKGIEDEGYKIDIQNKCNSILEGI